MKLTNPAGRTGPRAALAGQLLELFERASETSGGETVGIDLAGREVELRFAGTAMSERLLPALAHLRTAPSGEAALVIRIWDSDSTSTPAPIAPWEPDDFRERGIVRGYFGDGFYTVFDWGPQALNVVDVEHGSAFLWMRSTETIGLPERSAPLRTLLNLWLGGGDTKLVHGAAVGRADASVLLIGPSGAGKSSSALSCLETGLGHLGEDYCLVSRGDPPRVSSVYSSAKLRPEALSRLPVLAGIEAAMPGADDPEGKAMLDLAATVPEKLLRSAPLAAIAIPRITGSEDTRASRCSAGAALAAVAPSTMLQLPGNGEAEMRWLRELVSSVPCHQLALGSDPTGVAHAIEGLLGPA